jgi:NTP pyrophosphatase (non-canonical NTP hydrolase)
MGGYSRQTADERLSIAVEASELMELLQGVCDGEVDTLIKDRNNLAKLEGELADIIIYCLSLANTVNLDVAQAVVKKIRRNERRYSTEGFKDTYKKPTES